MDKNQFLIEEYRALRQEILVRLQLHHNIVLAASLLWLIFIIAGVIFIQHEYFNTYILLIPLVFTAITFNYQANQRTMEAAARYIEENIRSKAEEAAKSSVFGWERYFAGQKKRWQFSSIYTLFALLVPFAIPIILLSIETLSTPQLVLALVDIFFLLVIFVNFRYKLWRIK